MSRHRWEFDLGDGRHVVEFEQSYFLGTRRITVDGTKTTERGRPFMDHSGQYPIRLEGHGAAVWVTTNGFTYSFDLVVDGRSVTSGRTVTRVPRPPGSSPRETQVSGAFFVLLALPFIAFAGKGLYDEYRYRTASTTASGIVQETSTSAGRYGPNYRVSYVFTDTRGALWRGQGSISKAAYDAARPGSRFTVEYLRDELSTNRLVGSSDAPFIAILGAVGIVSAAVGAMTLLEGRRRARILRRVNEVGQPVTATVTKLKSGYVRGVGRTITVEYEYMDPLGNLRRGRGPMMYPQEGELYSIGGPARLLIDPDRPGDSVLLSSASSYAPAGLPLGSSETK
jgi:FAIM1 (Fas apoptotic inhibitory molecule) protein/uncharacterized protein DUF3592